ncbi:dTDP-4-dehydrorhamnose 3,5-epimerase [Sphaerisporangium sp. NBC_01403]|uniref:dTDP-4-dehydrorhamnose 3,5-epimerase family protein n=1 Tax=Sphaerisporangium TaxID=321315 RepID=UPI003244AD0B
MTPHNLVGGAVAFTPRQYPDHRGLFVSLMEESAFVAAVGHRPPSVSQISCSVSRPGVVRGLHYCRTPPGCAKFVYCPRGRVLDIVADIRVGSPTFGRWDSVILDDRDFRSVYIPVGMAHMFVSLEPNSMMSYALSVEYVAENELAVSPFDHELAIPLPAGLEPIVSDRDREAPTLAEALAAGALPDYDTCLRQEAELSQRLPV